MFAKAFNVATLALAATTLVSAQTSTDCDPTKTDCPANPALGTSVNLDFTKGADEAGKIFDNLAGTSISYDANGAVFTIANENHAPTMASKKFIFGGKLEVNMRAAPGAGIVTSIVLLSKDLDEIDFEWIGSDNAQVQSNYFGKGDTTTYDRGAYHAVANPTGEFHTYTIDWTKQYVKWSINGAVVRTLNYADAKGGATFPQTPMQVKLGSWVAGKKDAPAGTAQWAGGYTNFAEGPFIAHYKSIAITDYSTGAKQYIFGDRSGSWDSIIVDTTGSGSTNTTDNTTTSKPSGTTSAGDATKTTLSTQTTAGNTTGAATTSSGGRAPTGASTTTGSTPTATPNAAPKAVANVAVAAAGLFIAKLFL